MQFIHARQRNTCNLMDLKQHLFWKNISVSPPCHYYEIESNKYYFLECIFYRKIRTTFRQCIHEIHFSAFNIGTVPFRENNLSLAENEEIFNALYNFIFQQRKYPCNITYEREREREREREHGYF